MANEWRREAACRGQDPAWFFPERGEEVERALAVCAGCPVRDECRRAHMGEKFGIFGGLSERQREKARRQARRDGNPFLGRGQARITERRAEARNLADHGWDARQIAAALDLDERSVFRYLASVAS